MSTNPQAAADIMAAQTKLIKQLGLETEAKAVGIKLSNPYLEQFITTDPEMLALKDTVARLANKSINVLILGETGTGKELIAHALHGERKGNFVAVNCAGVPSELLESEFFGHERGAFTGAVQHQDGYIAQAQDGTLFLDEIGDLPMLLQSKLLRFLQDKRFRTVGGTKEHQSNCRIVCATNQNIPTMIARRRFRSDLYYRIKGTVLKLKPLSDRPEADVQTIVSKFSKRADKPAFAEYLIGLIKSDTLQGNVRELLSMIEEDNILNEGN